MNNGARLLALLVALQAALAWTVPTGVLCLSRDGHVALEQRDSACCHPEDHVGEDASRAVVSAREDLACCGPCLDIPLVQAPAAIASVEHEGLALPDTASARPLVVQASSLDTRSVPTPAESSPSAALVALRTVVLTC